MESRVPDFDAPYYLVNHNNNMDAREELRTVERLSEYAKLLWKVIQELLPDNYVACKGHGIEHLNDVLCRALEYRTLKYRTNESITDYIKNNFRLSDVDFYSFNLDVLHSFNIYTAEDFNSFHYKLESHYHSNNKNPFFG